MSEPCGSIARMAPESRHLSVFIDRPVAQVYAFASEPAAEASGCCGRDKPRVRVEARVQV